MAKFVRRYYIADHHNAGMVEVGPRFVLNPAKNHADYAAMLTLIENVEPELAQELRAHLDMIDQVPVRHLGSYGKECLPHITHPEVKESARKHMDVLEKQAAVRQNSKDGTTL